MTVPPTGPNEQDTPRSDTPRLDATSGQVPSDVRSSPDAPTVPAPPELPTWARPRASRDGMSDEQMALFIGPKWEKTYRRKFAAFVEDPSFVPTWNWSAAVVPPFWFLYRKLYLHFAAFFVLPGFAVRWLTGSDTVLTMQTVQLPENASLMWMSVAVFISSAIAAGGSANWFLFRRARAASQIVRLQNLPAAESSVLLRRWGGVNKSGTLLFVIFSLALSAAQVGA